MGSMTTSIAYNSNTYPPPSKENMSSYLIYIQIKPTLQLICLISNLLVNPEYQVHAEVDQTTP